MKFIDRVKRLRRVQPCRGRRWTGHAHSCSRCLSVRAARRAWVRSVAVSAALTVAAQANAEAGRGGCARGGLARDRSSGLGDCVADGEVGTSSNSRENTNVEDADREWPVRRVCGSGVVLRATRADIGSGACEGESEGEGARDGEGDGAALQGDGGRLSRPSVRVRGGRMRVCLCSVADAAGRAAFASEGSARA